MYIPQEHVDKTLLIALKAKNIFLSMPTDKEYYLTSCEEVI